MEPLFDTFYRKLQYTPLNFVRSSMVEINWDSRLIGIKGARGIGKTTLLLQYIKLNLADQLEKVLYVSLDSLWFNTNTLVALASEFVKKGGKFLFLDEVHKYAGWSQEIKNIYDDFPELKVVFTGSSLLEILNARADLSRRAVVYSMQGFSFREYLGIETGIILEPLSLDRILNNHVKEAYTILEILRPFQHFDAYLKNGYYPFYKEQPELFGIKLEQTINMILEISFPLLRGVELGYISRIKQLLIIIAQSVPFVANVSKLSEKINIHRTTLLSYLHYMDEIGLTRNLYKETKGISRLQKPAKIYLENTNLIYLLAPENNDLGNKRETFFANQLAYKHHLSYPEKGDFMIDNTYLFEVGGKSKSDRQIKNIKNAFVAADNIEYGFDNQIPLWLFGFLY